MPSSSIVSNPHFSLYPSEPRYIFLIAAGYYIPPIRSIIRDTFSRYPTVDKDHYLKPTSPTEIILSNPFVLSPILFCASILLAEGFMPL